MKDLLRRDAAKNSNPMLAINRLLSNTHTFGRDMTKNLAHKILESHLMEGTLIPGKEIAIRIDHTLL
jgi:hypothetical protein